MNSSYSISAVICTKDRPDDVLNLIHNLSIQTTPPHQVIVVDASDDSFLSKSIEESDWPFELIYMHTSAGVTYQRNIGAKNSSGDIVFFFDDDVLLEPDYIEEIVSVFDSDADGVIGGAMGRIVVSDDWLVDKPAGIKIKHHLVDIAKVLFLHNRSGNGRFRYSGFPTHPQDMDKSCFIECLSGGCACFRRHVFTDIRFDENLRKYGYMNDSDISKQLVDAGYKAYYQASARLRHRKSSPGRLGRYELLRMSVVYYHYLFWKHWSQNTLRRLAFWWAVIGFAVINLRHEEERRGVFDGVRIILNSQTPLSAMKRI